MSITPQRVERLRDNEIFVFGCRNSGRHWDGASAFALENFGAVMGQREGLQGRSYAIPTIGGRIGRRSIRKSVEKFTRFAAEHPELEKPRLTAPYRKFPDFLADIKDLF